MTMILAKFTSFAFTALFITTAAYGQIQKQFKTICAHDTRVAIIQSEGNCSIVTSPSDTINIAATLTASGTVYGLSKNNTPPFELVTLQEGDTIIISTTPINRMVSIGISTYKEDLDMQIAIPSSIVHLLVDSKYSITAKLVQQHIASLKCSAAHKLLVNNIEKAGEYEYGGTGAESIYLKGEHIELSLESTQ
jgi:hypothetical protein